jgi:hypothetical protein
MKTILTIGTPITWVAVCLPWTTTIAIISGLILTGIYIHKFKDKTNAFTR